ncbi:MAG: thiol reductase thioredoxin [Pseudomonas sp.]|uniref:thioredoxin family protein n=1 Tax=Stutzerimonas TaxID=2901164 RepID=UPI000C4D4B6B|nr:MULTISPECIES: thioredoxin family protein [Stutzerimonas]MAX92001.1 thiol reductase thioredoxin [Pseudomonas sp.]MBU1301046.1 thioredoxin family protein [Gammaproteobacteria bacterium]MBU2280950.1 thioredoxin family protein [Gammaproteobacteria bacterium]MCQ4280956.1 thioredoxin family protein [Stutzerimonas stutzeri]MDX2352732.1 thioredoxin family protein [Stutzerimonas xanthomarina]|tara:strand:- start:14201 stop:14527 length:327 start_codon:yes stop_codon:yes gene_type:complete
MADLYKTETITRSEVDSLDGITVLDFGTNWCGHCRSAEPHVERALADFPQINHIKIEDGQGRPLGRSYRVKLWPTLVFVRLGQELSRVVRPTSADAVREAAAKAADQS